MCPGIDIYCVSHLEPPLFKTFSPLLERSTIQHLTTIYHLTLWINFGAIAAQIDFSPLELGIKVVLRTPQTGGGLLAREAITRFDVGFHLKYCLKIIEFKPGSRLLVVCCNHEFSKFSNFIIFLFLDESTLIWLPKIDV